MAFCGDDIIKICELCGKEYHPSYLPQRFCSNSCANRVRKKNIKVTKQCKFCEKDFQCWPYEQNSKQFCNKECKKNYHNRTHKCKGCDNQTDYRRKFCSRKCCNKFRKGKPISEILVNVTPEQFHERISKSAKEGAKFILVKCSNCTKEFEKNQYEIEKIKSGLVFCSSKCNNEHLSKRNKKSEYIKKTCPGCGGIYCAPRSDKGKVYCSIECYRKDITKGRFYQLCLQCGIEFEMYPYEKDKRKFCSQSCAGTWHLIHDTFNKQKNKETSIELKIRQILEELVIPYFPQYSIRLNKKHTIPDFFVIPNIVIYCDGDYWHNRPGAQEEDAIVNDKLLKSGYRVIRFWGSHINHRSDYVKTILKKTILENKIENHIEEYSNINSVIF